MFDGAAAARITLLSLMASIGLIQNLSAKKTARAVKEGKPLPDNLRESLTKTMAACTELNLSIPGTLQAKTLHFSNLKRQS